MCVCVLVGTVVLCQREGDCDDDKVSASQEGETSGGGVSGGVST